jgi:hypothetical protein
MFDGTCYPLHIVQRQRNLVNLRKLVSAIAIFKIQITYRAHPVYFITILNILEVILNTLLVKEATKR